MTGTINIVLNIITLLLGGTLVGVFLRYRLGLKKLASGDVADIRDHYASEVSALRGKVLSQEEHFRGLEKHWREMLDHSDRRHQECEEARTVMRAELEGLHGEIRGLRDQILRYSSSAVLTLQNEPSEDIKAAALRVQKILDEREGKE